MSGESLGGMYKKAWVSQKYYKKVRGPISQPRSYCFTGLFPPDEGEWHWLSSDQHRNPFSCPLRSQNQSAVEHQNSCSDTESVAYTWILTNLCSFSSESDWNNIQKYVNVVCHAPGLKLTHSTSRVLSRTHKTLYNRDKWFRPERSRSSDWRLYESNEVWSVVTPLWKKTESCV